MKKNNILVVVFISMLGFSSPTMAFDLFGAVGAVTGAISTAEGVSAYKSGKSTYDNRGMLRGYDKVYVDVSGMTDPKKAAEFSDTLQKEWLAVSKELTKAGQSTPSLFAYSGNISDLKVDSEKVAVIRLLPRDSDGVIDTVSNIGLEHAHMVVLRMGESVDTIAEQDVELSDGMFDSWDDKTKGIRGVIISYLYKYES